MKPIFTILNKVLVKEFYHSNASFFLVVIGLGAGFMRSYEHMALAEFFVGSPIVLLIPITLWILYALKVISFNVELLNRNENEFLYNMPLLPEKEQWIGITQAVSAQLLPMVLYGVFLSAVALKNNMPQILSLICISCLLIIIFSSFRLLYALRHPHV
ncbi:MAG: hypothetical protein C0490_22460, partial [Marivirga sp.]|nr:hypothetical protein [Marivirga sp.]